MHEYDVILERVIDGDTCVVLVDLGLDVFKREHLRLADVDAPETRSRDEYEKRLGNDAKAYLEQALGSAGSRLRIRASAPGKFGRLVAFVYAGEDPVSVNEHLIEQGFAFRYDGTSSRDGHDLDELKRVRMEHNTWTAT